MATQFVRSVQIDLTLNDLSSQINLLLGHIQQGNSRARHVLNQQIDIRFITKIITQNRTNQR